MILADVEPQEVKAFREGDDARLVLVERQTLGASQAASRALTSNACCLVWQRATKSSAYLISTGEPSIVFPALAPVGW